jgi:hypothetical protein
VNHRTWQGLTQDVDAVERQLIAKGYILVQKRDSKTLLPGEYIKSTFIGSETSFDGPGGCTLTWSPRPDDR